MLKVIFIATLVGSTLAAPKFGPQTYEEAQECDHFYCKLPYCLCTSSRPPLGLDPKDVPQLVLLTFDDAVSVLNIDFYNDAFNGRKNPDECPIGVTYFVTHDYTDYSIVHDLWARGHEIAMHSITHKTPQDLWKNTTVEEHKLEFADQIKLTSHFAKIPDYDISGIRIPFLQLSGDNSFRMIEQTTFKYDCSWPTQNKVDSGFWPYTLDYKTDQDCASPPCPTSRIPSVWVVPMVNWRDSLNETCAMVDACINMPQEENEMLELMINNFNRHYYGTRSPFGFYVHAAWFAGDQRRFNVYNKFLDHLQSQKDVYLVSIKRALQWVENPSVLGNLQESWPTCQTVSDNTCGAHTCQLKKGETEERWMRHCAEGCPAVYPWLGNPYGEKQ